MSESNTPENASLEARTKAGIEKVNSGSVKLADLLKVLAPPPANPETKPASVLAAVIPKTTVEALERLPEVYGSVVPTERRALTTVEVSSLMDEAQTIGSIEKTMAKRKADIRTTVFQHFDVTLEGTEGFDPDAEPRDKDGFYVHEAKAETEPGQEYTFTREVREPAPSLSEKDLYDLIDDESVEFTKEDYLAMTRQVRILDEAAITIALRKKPELVAALAKVLKPGTKTASFNTRKV